MQSLSQQREKFSNFRESVGRFFSKFPISANGYTILSLLFVFISFFFLINNLLLYTFIFFLLAGFLDTIDGCVARFRKEESKKGAYLDTIIDRYVEGIFLLGLLFLPFPKILLPSYVWIFLLFFGSLMTTYAKSAAKEKEVTENGQELKIGFIQRPERIILLCIGLLIGYFFGLKYFLWIIIFLAILTNLSAIQRIIYTFKNAR